MPEGASTIRGTVASFENEQAFFVPTPKPSALEQAVADVMELIVPSAHARRGGIVVRVRNTDLSTTTSSDGFFVISGVPPGNQVLIFSIEEKSAELPLDIPANSTTELEEISINEGVAKAARVNVEIHEETPQSGADVLAGNTAGELGEESGIDDGIVIVGDDDNGFGDGDEDRGEDDDNSQDNDDEPSEEGGEGETETNDGEQNDSSDDGGDGDIILFTF